MSERAVNPADYEPCADASPRLVAARKAAIRAAFNYRWTHGVYGQVPHIATDEQIERCYENFEDNGAWAEIVVAADAAVSMLLDNLALKEMRALVTDDLRASLTEMLQWCPAKRGEWMDDKAFEEFRNVRGRAAAALGRADAPSMKEDAPLSDEPSELGATKHELLSAIEAGANRDDIDRMSRAIWRLFDRADGLRRVMEHRDQLAAAHAEVARRDAVNADLINVILSEAGVEDSPYLAVKIANTIELNDMGENAGAIRDAYQAGKSRIPEMEATISRIYAQGLEDAARRCEHTASMFRDPHCDSAATARALAKTIRALGEKGPTDAHAD